ncbi:MAG: Rrf2 family transcriptional regulator [Rhodobacteraceae bacterium]|nr:Rrf2 family transcriptional regulator [Paracoccaceae bacterium]
MKLSKFSDYAVRVCLYLGAHQGRAVPISEIARAHDVSHGNLMKVVQILVESGFLKSIRGRSGGVRLARSAADIRLGQIVRQMEGDDRLVDCSSCILQNNCGVVAALFQAKVAFYQALDKHSLADAILASGKTLPILQAAAESAPAANAGSDL